MFIMIREKKAGIDKITLSRMQEPIVVISHILLFHLKFHSMH